MLLSVLLLGLETIDHIAGAAWAVPASAKVTARTSDTGVASLIACGRRRGKNLARGSTIPDLAAQTLRLLSGPVSKSCLP